MKKKRKIKTTAVQAEKDKAQGFKDEEIPF